MGFSYDSHLDKFFVYGGKDDTPPNGVPLDTTWQFDPVSSQWTQLSASTGIAHSSTRMVYQPYLNAPVGRLVMYGGGGDPNTWLFDGGQSSTWSQCANCASAVLGARTSEGMSFYPANVQNRVVVLFGGDKGGMGDFDAPTDAQADTWTLTGDTEANARWVQCTTQCVTHPSLRSGLGLAYYKVTNKAILYGGRDGGIVGDTWRYDHLAPDQRWEQCTGTGCTPIVTDCTQGPPPCTRASHRMSYYEDTAGNMEIVMFGGTHDGSTVLGDVWLFTGNPGGWVKCDPGICLPPPDGPEARCCGGITFDTTRRKIFMFGGQVPPKPQAYKDLWTWTATGGWHCESPLWCNVETPP